MEKRKPRDEVILVSPSSRQRAQFIVGVSVAVILVFVGWIFSLRDFFTGVRWSIPGTASWHELSQGMRGIVENVQNQSAPSVSGLQQAVATVTLPLEETVQKRVSAMEVVASLMKQELEHPSAILT